MCNMLDLNYGTVPFAAIDYQPLCCLWFTAGETEAQHISLASCCGFQLQLFLRGRTGTDLAGKANIPVFSPGCQNLFLLQ